MIPAEDLPDQRWHSSDLLVQLEQGRIVGTSSATTDFGGTGESSAAADVKFGSTTLALVAADSERHERLTVLRSSAFDDRDLIVFGARAKSVWALDAVVGRLTNQAHDWSSFRAAVFNAVSRAETRESVLTGIPLDRLYNVCELLHERNLDSEAERGLLQFVAARTLSGGQLTKGTVQPLIERLLQHGLAEQARALLPRLSDKDWISHAFAVELEHPRFGGSFDSMLALLNEPYRQLGLEPVTLDAPGPVPYQRLDAAPASTARPGPLITVIMTSWCPGEEILTAVRSIVGQTYQEWELLICDDASPAEYDFILERVAALDPRVRVIRNEVNEGTYVRRNEAIQAARGEFVTMQDSDDWSHPHRLEIQVHDLLVNPARLANVIHAARVTEDFSVVSSRGARLYVSEPSLMFRREPVTAAVGYYDSIRKSADTEFRKRLESVTRRAIPALLPGAPLMFMLADPASLSGADFGTNIWNHPDRLTYWSATRRYLQRIESGALDPYLPFPLSERVFHAPAAWLPGPRSQQFDVLVVLDGREWADRSAFHAVVAEELNAAVAAGLRVALLQSDTVVGPRGMAFFPPVLQALVDSGAVARIGADQDITATVAVVRHAGAAQGHPARRLSATVTTVVVIEDVEAGDARGRTIAKRDVMDTATAWFGVEPTWVVALPTLPPPTVSAVAFDGGVRLTIATGVPANIKAIRLHDGSDERELRPDVVGAVSAIGSSQDPLTPGNWGVIVDYDAGAGRVVSRPCAITIETVIWNSTDRVGVRTEEGSLMVLPAESSVDQLGSRDFAAEYLSAEISLASVVDERFEITMVEHRAAVLAGVYALREVDGAVVRRRDFTAVTASTGSRLWRRPLSKFADSRWQIFGSFRTPRGLVEFPIPFGDALKVEGTDAWQPQVLSGGRLIVTAPPAGKLTRVAQRVGRAVETRFGGRADKGSRRGTAVPASSGRRADERIVFDARHSVPRDRNAPRVTVVMPVYNVEPFLDTAISSVLGQDFTDLELIIIDDASTDNGRRIIEKYWRKDLRVRVFALDHNTIGGAGVPSNVGMRAARGTYVAFADSDDHVTKTGLAKLVQLADHHNAELVIGDFRTFSDKLKDGAVPYDHAAWSEVPLNTPISAFSHPALIKLSPVPWRKLYRREFLNEHGILYPEGDYFYEDNPLHWFVLSRAHRVVACDEVVSYHRQEREGQTMSAQAYKLGAFVSHANTILNFLDESSDDRRDVLFESFFEYLDRCHWTVANQTQPIAAALIRRGLGDIYHRAVEAAPAAEVPARVRPRLATYRSAYRDIDLTVVIPVFNSADLLPQTLDSVLALTGIRFNVLLVDDGSTDDSLTVLRQYERRHSNVHVFAQGNRGAGRARNSIIPLSTGRYTFFLDADDVIDAESLVAAVAQADAESADLFLVKYRIEYTDEGRSQGMFGGDRQIWEQLPQTSSNAERQQLAARLINYPWNRLIRTSLLHDANIFFGATVVHNDVQFHWHSVTSATSIGYLDVEVCTHRKFATRDQVTNISDARRMAVLEALRATHERISDLPSYPNVQDEWEKFALHLLEWAKSRIPDALQARYGVQSEALAQSFAG
ncbi:glycosyltransferase [Microbacterium jejuense]|uniref:glycosyltransferase n=1 Tax=Microbacterium jejuense TaxID=1263637 RepID=UPI0031ECCA56